ncbi:hypothetical protein B0T21DRAFT_369583 [Apiosordaria backusii]|uniref:Secreted protein n=1 Tax=Apiosordaria backusii TaxID=314023 RepID=A0AA40BEE8_9PEZI|nr:hypothetical protein B0T21DRAFT_369583 [Apiosordaria backusii]
MFFCRVDWLMLLMLASSEVGIKTHNTGVFVSPGTDTQLNGGRSGTRLSAIGGLEGCFKRLLCKGGVKGWEKGKGN